MQKYPWIIRFIQIAAKSIAEINYDYKEWNLGFSGIKSDTERVKFLSGMGIGLAQETHVCSKIVRECVSSPLFSGAIIDDDPENDIKKGIRYWKIESEKSYSFNSRKKCDIVAQRYDWDLSNWNLSPEPYREVYIEAKRAYLGAFTKASKKSQQEDIVTDIIKFSDEYKHFNDRTKVPYFYLLVWSELNNANSAGAEEYLEELNELYKNCPSKDLEIKLSIAQQEWIPQKWSFEKNIPTIITSSIWICLFSVEFIESS